MQRLFRVALLALLTAAFGQRLDAQELPAALSITVRDIYGRLLSEARVTAGTAGTLLTDSTGYVAIAAIRAGPIRILVRHIGNDRADTTLALLPGERRDVVLTLQSYEAGNARRTREAGGDFTTDSVALGRVHMDTIGWFTFSRFSARLLDRLVRERTTMISTMVSGYSAGQALSLASLGARGETATQILASLGAIGLTGDSLAQLNQRFSLSLRDRRDVTLKVANAIWVDSTQQLTAAFKHRIAVMNPIPVQSVRLDSDAGVARINAWANDATEGKISEIVARPLMNRTKFFIANAIYLKAAWLEPFEKSLTKPRPFHSADGSIVQVPTMHDTRYLAYRRDSGWQAVRLPFRSGLTAIYVILPDSGRPIAPILARFARVGLEMPVATAAPREVELCMPQLHLDQELNLIPSMKRLGVVRAFDRDRADFTELLVLQPSEVASVNLFTQHVVLDLDEEGAVAVAVSALGGVSITSYVEKPPPIRFFVDRPFLFVIQDERTHTALFTGYIAKP